jgi:PAS domain S-box-containing protein
MFGYGEAEARGRMLSQLIVPDVYEAESSAIHRTVVSGGTVLKELMRRHKDGRLVPVEINISPIRDSSGKVTSSTIVYRDIGERRRGEDALRRHAAQQTLLLDAARSLHASEERLRLSHEGAGLGHWDLDFAGGTLVWSEQTRKLFGVEPAEPASIALLLSRVHAEDRPRVEEQIARSLSPDSDHIYHVEYRIVTQNGAARWLEDQGRLETDPAGVPVRAFGVVRDITARKNAEEAQARLAAIVTSSADAVVGKTLDGTVTSWNEAAERMFGYPANEMIGQSVRRLIPADRQLEEDTILARLTRSECVECHETMLLAKDGRTFDASVTISPMRDAEGRIIGCSKIIRDITERKRTERALADSEARFRATFENAAVGIAHLDPKIRWLRVNEALCRILGYPADELVTKSLQDITHPDDLAADLAHVEDMRDGKLDSYVMDKRYVRKDGVIVWARLTVSCVRNSDGSIDYFVSVVEDITARKHAEEELRKSEERFRSSVLHSPLPLLLFDDREQILALSQSWLEGSNYSSEELGRIEDWTARAYGERSGEVLEHIRQIISTEPQAQLAEMMIRTKDGRERLWSFVSSALGAQSDGRRLFVCVAQDVTERKAHDQHVHLLMHEVNHRAKNMLSLVQAIARQTAAREPEDFVGRFSERIRALAANQDLLVRNEWQGVDVEDLVRSQLSHFADLVGSRIAVHGRKLHLNAAAAQAIGLALHELATNAGKYGALSVDAGRVDVRWQLEGDIFTMSWTERNGPPVSRPKRRGFGSTVIDSMAKLTVGGEIQLDYAPVGLLWRLACPAANALEWGYDQTGDHADAEAVRGE